MSWYPDLPHVQAAGDGGPRSTTQMVVIHATDNTASAEAEASYATRRPDQVSAHFYVDGDSVVQALDTTHVAWGCWSTGNNRSVQFELCGRSNQISDATMRQAAPIVARVCREFGLPIRKLSAADLRAGTRGICGHADVTAAWLQGDHTDPGTSFPWSTFLTYVQAASSGQNLGDDMGLTGPEYDQLIRGAITKDNALFYWLRRIAEGRNPLTGAAEGVGLPQLQSALLQLATTTERAAADDQVRDQAMLAAIQALTAGGTSVDTAAVVAAIQAVRDELAPQLADLRARAERAEAEEAQLRQALAAALQPAGTAPTE